MLHAQEEISVIENNYEHAHQLQGTATYNIGYGERLEQMHFIGDPIMGETTWVIKNEKNKTIAKGSSSSVADFLYEKPGKYTIDFTLSPVVFERELAKGRCFHPSVPARVEVMVSANKIKFLLEELRFEHPLIGGVDQKGNTLYLPAIVSTYDGKAFYFANNIMRTAGVDANVTGILAKNQTYLKPGKHMLEYHLQGSVRKDSYIMIDLADAMGNIQSVAIPEIIK